MLGVLVGTDGCSGLPWAAAVAPGAAAERLSRRSSDVTFRLLDADDDRPIVGGHLALTYHGDWYRPEGVWDGTTDDTGEVRLPVIHRHAYQLTLRSDGYMLLPEDVPAEAYADPPPKLVVIRLLRFGRWGRVPRSVERPPSY